MEHGEVQGGKYKVREEVAVIHTHISTALSRYLRAEVLGDLLKLLSCWKCNFESLQRSSSEPWECQQPLEPPFPLQGIPPCTSKALLPVFEVMLCNLP